MSLTQSQYRIALRLLEYNPGKRERYVLRVQIEILQQFTALPYSLSVEYKPAGKVHTFRLRGLTVAPSLLQSPTAVSYLEDIIIAEDGSAYVVVAQAEKTCTIPLLLERGSVTVGDIETAQSFFEVHVSLE